MNMLNKKYCFFRLHEYVHRRHNELGSIYCENLSSTDIVFISDPSLMKMLFLKLEGKYPMHILPDSWILYQKLYGSKRGLLFMDGEEWLHYRRIMNKYLLNENPEAALETSVKRVIEKIIIKWKANAVDGRITPNVENEFYRLSIDGNYIFIYNSIYL